MSAVRRCGLIGGSVFGSGACARGLPLGVGGLAGDASSISSGANRLGRPDERVLPEGEMAERLAGKRER